MDVEKVVVEIEDALSGNLAKTGHVYKLSLNGLKDKALTDVLSLLKEQPEIIRCKDCKHYRINTVYPGTNMIMKYCAKTGIAESGPDWFCADGERKDEDG